MANYVSKHTGTQIDAAVEKVPVIEKSVATLTEEIAGFTTAPFTADNKADAKVPVACYPIAGSDLQVTSDIHLFQDFNENPAIGIGSPWTIYPRETVTITQSNAAGESKTYTVQMPDGVYKGKLDVVSGLLTVTHKMFALPVSDMNNSDDYPGWRNIEALNGLGECLEPTDNGTLAGRGYISNICIDVVAAGNRITYILNSTTTLVLLSKNSFGTQTEIKTNYPDLVVQLLIPLLEPYTVEVTPQEIHALDGKNMILSDVGVVEVSGVATGGIHAVSPWSFGLPVPKLTGDTSAMSKDNAVVLSSEFNGVVDTASVKWQGSSSLAYPEKNYTIVFDTPFEAKEGWGEQTKYVMKADWVDASHMLNVLGALIWGQIVKREGSGFPAASQALPNGGAIDGFPVLLVINDKLQGLYTFTIPKDGWLAGMTGIEGEFILNADGNNAACAFKEIPANDDSDFEAEYTASDETLAVGREKLATCVADTVSAVETGENVDAPFDNLNYDSALDYMVFCACMCNPDGITKNYQLFGRPGLPLQFSAYDMDAILGNHYNGKSYYAPNYMTYADLANGHNVFKLIYTYKKEDLKVRHKLLRDTILNEANILTTLTNYAVQIPSAVLDEERRIWPEKPGTLTNDIGRMMNFLRARLAIVDAEIEAL